MNIAWVMHDGRRYIANLPVRESLFQDLKDTNPRMEIDLLDSSANVIKKVFIEELVLWSVFRNTP